MAILFILFVQFLIVMGDARFEFRQGQDIFLFSQPFRHAVRPTQPPIYWFPGFFFWEYSGQSVQFTGHLI
jgi:hypothetical protein